MISLLRSERQHTNRAHSETHFPFFISRPIPPGLNLSLGGNIFFEEGVPLGVRGRNELCASTQWDAALHPVTLRILAGEEYATFRNVFTRERLGTSITSLARDLGSFALAADGKLPDSGGAVVVVQAESNGLIVIASVRVKPYYFRISAEPSTIAVGEEALLRIKTVDAQGNPYERPFNLSPVGYVGIVEGGVYGTLVYGYASGSEIERGDTLHNIETDVTAFESGFQLKFLANEQSPTDSAEVRFVVVKTGEGSSWYPIPPELYPFDARDTVRGIGGVVVTKSAATIALDIPTPKEIWPTLPAGRSGGNPGKRNVKERITVTAARGGVPAINYEVEISATMVLPSGGHEHTPPPPQALLGELKDIRTGRKGKGTLKTETDTEGKIVLEYTAPEFSGKFEVTAKSTTEQGEDKDELTVKVPELQPLPAGQHYRLIGLFGEPGVISEHRKNHFGTETLIAKVRTLANAVYQDSAYVLRINDISLPWGGVFDIENNWSTPHSRHRVGINVDIDDLDANGKRIDAEYLERLVRSKTFQGRFFSEGTHFHLTFR